MCRLFVFAKADNASDDPRIDAQKFKRGHVVDVLEDGQHGGKEAEESGLFEIIEIPGEPAAKYRYLCSGDALPLTFAPQPTIYPRLRINVLDLDAIKASPDTAKAISAHVAVASRIPVSGVIGDSPLVIG